MAGINRDPREMRVFVKGVKEYVGDMTLTMRTMEGYLDACMLEESEEGTTLRLTSRDPEQDPGNGAETVLWFDPGTFQLLRGEIWQDGFCVIQCEFSTFSNQMKDSG